MRNGLSLGLSLFSSNIATGPLGAPTVSSVSPAIGDINGGEAITINGTNFDSSVTVTIGGNSATSVVFVNSGQLTCVTAAHAAGVANIVVTTTAGNSGTTGNGLYEFYDPTALFDWYGSGEGYAVVTGTGTLTARKGVNLSEATHPPLVGSGARQLGGKNTIDSHTVTNPKLAAAATNLSTYLPLTSAFGVAIVNFDAVEAFGDSIAYLPGQVFSDNGGGYQGLSASTNATNHFQVWGFDSATEVADPSTSMSAGTWYMVVFKRDGTKIYQRLGSGSWSAGVTCGTLGGTGNFKMFENFSATDWLDGRVAALGLSTAIPSDANITKLISYVNAHWGTSF